MTKAEHKQKKATASNKTKKAVKTARNSASHAKPVQTSKNVVTWPLTLGWDCAREKDAGSDSRFRAGGSDGSVEFNCGIASFYVGYRKI